MQGCDLYGSLCPAPASESPCCERSTAIPVVRVNIITPSSQAEAQGSEKMLARVDCRHQRNSGFSTGWTDCRKGALIVNLPAAQLLIYLSVMEHGCSTSLGL